MGAAVPDDAAATDAAGGGEAEGGPAVQLAGGDVTKIRLTGQHAQLGNSGGVIRVIRLSDGGVIHAVTYTAQGAGVSGRTLVF